MTLDRRTFIVGTGMVAMTPVFEPWALAAAPALNAEVHRVEFMIEEWSVDDGKVATDRVWLRLDRSWRTAWR